MLEQNYPNPFKGATSIKYIVPEVEKDSSNQRLVVLKVLDVFGGHVVGLVNEYQRPGTYEIIFDVQSLQDYQSLPEGVYYCKLIIDHQTFTNKMIILK